MLERVSPHAEDAHANPPHAMRAFEDGVERCVFMGRSMFNVF